MEPSIIAIIGLDHGYCIDGGHEASSAEIGVGKRPQQPLPGISFGVVGRAIFGVS